MIESLWLIVDIGDRVLHNGKELWRGGGRVETTAPSVSCLQCAADQCGAVHGPIGCTMAHHPRDESSPGSHGSLDEAAVHAELGRIVLGEASLGSVLETLAHLARRAIPGAGEVSVTLVEPNGKAHSVAFTGVLASALDERQYEKGFGPCMDAAQTGKTIVIEDTSISDAYPEFVVECTRLGVTNTLAVGTPVPQRSVGAINVYGVDAKPFDMEAVAFVESLAGYVAVALANAALFDRTSALAKQMQQAMESRAVIEQAKGVIMARDVCSPDDAFETLTNLSQSQNRKLRDVAGDVVAEFTTDQG